MNRNDRRRCSQYGGVTSCPGRGQVAPAGSQWKGLPVEASAMSSLLTFGRWIGDAIAHAFGNPREEALTQPPLIGVQPYRDQPRRR